MKDSSRPLQAVLAVSVPPASLNKVKLKVLNKDTNNPKVKDKLRGVTVAHKVSAVPDILTEATKLRIGLSTVSTEVAGTVTLDGSSRSPVASERLVDDGGNEEE